MNILIAYHLIVYTHYVVDSTVYYAYTHARENLTLLKPDSEYLVYDFASTCQVRIQNILPVCSEGYLNLPGKGGSEAYYG